MASPVIGNALRRRGLSPTVFNEGDMVDIGMPEQNIEKVWELIEKIPICMLSTWTGSELRSRPMDARPRRMENMM